MIGTKNGEYARTIEILMDKLDSSQESIAEILYFLYDSQYDNSDLKAMAELIVNKQTGILKR